MSRKYLGNSIPDRGNVKRKAPRQVQSWCAMGVEDRVGEDSQRRRDIYVWGGGESRTSGGKNEERMKASPGF